MEDSFTTIWGEYPPLSYGGNDNMEQDTKPNLWRKIFSISNTLLGTLFIIGSILIWQTNGFWHDIGIAFVIAGILGLTIDNYLKRELAKEAVKSALGYVLPEPLKEEMRWVVGCKLLAVEHTADYEIRLNQDGKTVRFGCEMTRRIKNFTDVAQDVSVGLSIDEFGIKDNPSKMELLSYHMEGKDWEYVNVGTPLKTPDTISIAPQRLSLPAKKWIEVKTRFYETKQLNDVHHMVFTYPTVKPIIHVKVDERIIYRKGFAHRNTKDDENILQGTLLPLQAIYVRWWLDKK